MTAGESAKAFDLHPNVARHHLDKLTAGGHLDVSVERPPTQRAGRPSKRYRATAEAMTLEVPVGQDDILITLLGRALTRLPAEEAEAVAEEVGVEFGRTMAASLVVGGDPQRSLRSSLHAVADALSAHGFSAHAEKRGGELRIVSEHCPFGDAAIEHPVICAVDRGMVKGMLAAIHGDTTPTTPSSRPMGDPVCVTAVAE